MLNFDPPSTTPWRRRDFASLLVRAGAGLGLVAAGAVPCSAQRPSVARPLLKVAYLSELPLSWRTGMGDPLRNLARSLGAHFSRSHDFTIAEPVQNVFGAESWEELSRTIQLGQAEIFPIHAYEYLLHGSELGLTPLLMATRNDNAWQTRYVLLANKDFGTQSLHDLKDRTILIHRDGCGNLVDLWLDSAIAKGTGMPRKSFARYETVTQAREAVLPVFFGEADACVVTEAAYAGVRVQNPVQIHRRLNEMLRSEDFPSQIVVCRKDWPLDLQRRVVETGRGLSWEFDGQQGGLVAVEEVRFDHLRHLLNQRDQPGSPTGAAVPPAGRLQTSSPTGKPPAKRP